MKYHSTKPLLLSIIILLLAGASYAQKAYVLSSHKVSVDGTSSLHDWSSEVTKVDWSGKITADATSVKAISDVTMTIAVLNIKSEKGGTMDDKTYEAFDAEKNKKPMPQKWL